MDGRNLRLGLTAMLALVVLAVIALLSVQPAGASITGDLPPASGDWVINNPTTVIDEIVQIYDGNITVNSRLTIWGSTILIDPLLGWDEFDLFVSKGASLQSNNSHFESPTWYFDCFVDGTMDLDTCNMYYLMDFNISGTLKANSTDIRYGDSLHNVGTLSLTGDSRLYMWNYVTLGGTVTVDDSRIERTYNELAIRGTCRFIMSYIQYTYGVFNLTGLADFDNCDIYYVDSEFRLTGTAKMNGTSLRYLYFGLNHTGGLSITEGYGYRIYDGMWLAGDTYIDGSEFWYVYGVVISDDDVLISDTVFENMLNLGMHLDHCDATMDNVTLDVYSGTAIRYFKTDMPWTEDDPYQLTMANGIWVDGGNPSFTDVMVYASSRIQFELEYTGTDRDVEIYARAMAAVVLIESKDVETVTGITVMSSSFYVYTYFRATDPGMNPQTFFGSVGVVSAGIAVVNYDQVTITDVDVGNVYVSRINRYTYGGYYSNSGSYWQGPSTQLAGAVGETYSASSRTTLTLRDMTVDMSYGLLATYWMPGYSGSGVPILSDAVRVINVTINHATGLEAFFFYSRPIYDGEMELVKSVDFTNCEFNDLSTGLVYYTFEPGPGISPTEKTHDVSESLALRNSTIQDSYYIGPFVYTEGVYTNLPMDEWDRKVTFADCTFQDYVGAAWQLEGREPYIMGKDTLEVINCHFENLTDDGVGFGPYYTFYFDTVRFKGNTLLDMGYGETGDFYDMGGSSSGVRRVDWLFENNRFDNCTNRRWMEVINLDYGGDVVVRGNDVGNMNGLISMYHETMYTTSASLTVEDNVFHDNMAYIVEFGNVDAGNRFFTVTVSGNEFYGNEDFLFNYWGKASTIDANSNRDATFVFDDNNFHDNMGGLIHVWGAVSVTDNTFTDNVGPLAFIDHIDLNLPVLSGNVLSGNVDLFALKAKDRGYQLVSMDLADFDLDCTGVALSFTNMEVELTRVDITGADLPLYAHNSYIDVYWSNIDGDSCMVEANGQIRSWWSMEVYVTWGDKDGMDSLRPVADCLVVLYDASDDYYTSDYADGDGMLAAQEYLQWTVDLGGPLWSSPFDVKVASAGATNSESVSLNSNLVGDEKVHIILLDAYEPNVAITDPYSGAIFAVDELSVKGFVTEVGSGITSVEYSVSGTDWLPLNLEPSGDWTLQLTELFDGDVEILVRATDMAGNNKEAMVTITIDTTPPSLTVGSLPAITNLAMMSITGTVEAGAELFINGVPHVVEGTTINTEISLHEGVNAIVVEAMDEAGNVAIRDFIVLLDTFAPVLVVTGPANGLTTSANAVEVTGIVEEGATLTVNGAPVVVDEHGAFSVEVDLETGENRIVVTATDDATNIASFNLTVTMDRVPPSVEITAPADGLVTKASVVEVQISADENAMLWLNGRPLVSGGQVTRTVALLEGSNAIVAKARDMAGNEATDQVTVIRDTYPPNLIITSPTTMELWTKAQTLDIAGTAEGAEDVYVNGATATLTEESFTYTATLVVGMNNLTVVATDGTNEVSQVIQVHVKRDAPVLNVNALTGVIKEPSVTVEGNTAAGIPWVMVTYGGTTDTFAVNYDGTFKVILNLEDGTYNVEVKVVDRYGNEATGQTGSFEVNAPSLEPEDEEEGLGVEPWHIGLILVALGLALLIGAAWAYYTLSRREEEL